MHSLLRRNLVTLTVCLVLGVLGTPARLDAATSSSAAAGAASPADLALGERVRNALHDDPYVDDEHIDVSVVHGKVILRGFVQDDWDLHDAVRIANHAARPHRVIDELKLKLGGEKR